MTYVSLPEEAESELATMLATWQYDNYFPSDYDPTMIKGVKVVRDWPSDQIKNIQGAFVNGMLSKPIVSVIPIMVSPETSRNGGLLGNVMGPGAGNTIQYGQTYNVRFQVDCWTDKQTGEGPQAKRIGGGVIDAVFVNRNSLAAFRRLKASGGRLIYGDASQLWRFSLDVTGRLVQSYQA